MTIWYFFFYNRCRSRRRSRIRSKSRSRSRSRNRSRSSVECQCWVTLLSASDDFQCLVLVKSANIECQCWVPVLSASVDFIVKCQCWLPVLSASVEHWVLETWGTWYAVEKTQLCIAIWPIWPTGWPSLPVVIFGKAIFPDMNHGRKNCLSWR